MQKNRDMENQREKKQEMASSSIANAYLQSASFPSSIVTRHLFFCFGSGFEGGAQEQ